MLVNIEFNNTEVFSIIDVHLKCCGDGELILTESDRRISSSSMPIII